jgi:hypothetical protein
VLHAKTTLGGTGLMTSFTLRPELSMLSTIFTFCLI